ncbi:hypothetical protein ACHAXA_010594 [Cyclostephanos tholiformis]|uniref:Mitochondrial carrier protein n=1 Tax=Cyclostephanos tholiformis TaxID=382380 RepID=A0ABD3RZC5_9STRA
MGGTAAAKGQYPLEYAAASTLAAILNYPLWRASALGQSGFRVAAVSSSSALPASLLPYVFAFSPPYKGMFATVLGMSWARAAIFYGSDRGKILLESYGFSPTVSIVFPPLIVSTLVQIINMPLVRATVSLQNPESDVPNIRESFRRIYGNHGVSGLWHGTSAGILKSVPKYCTAIFAKDYIEGIMPPIDPDSSTRKRDELLQSAIKASAAGVAGAALTNPLDVIRNEMFKTNLGFLDSCRSLREELGYRFLIRGMSKNLIAVSLPVASTIFFTDAFISRGTE